MHFLTDVGTLAFRIASPIEPGGAKGWVFGESGGLWIPAKRDEKESDYRRRRELGARRRVPGAFAQRFAAAARYVFLGSILPRPMENKVVLSLSAPFPSFHPFLHVALSTHFSGARCKFLYIYIYTVLQRLFFLALTSGLHLTTSSS